MSNENNPQYRFKVATASTYEKALEKVAAMKENGKIGRIRRIADCFVVQEVRGKLEPVVLDELMEIIEPVAVVVTPKPSQKEKPKRYMRGH